MDVTPDLRQNIQTTADDRLNRIVVIKEDFTLSKEKNVTISNPDDLNEHLQSSSPVTWIVLGATIALMLGFFVWSFLFKMPVKLSGSARVEAGQATLVVAEEAKGKLTEGQKVYILDQQGVVSLLGDTPVVYNLSLEDGDYTYRTDIVLEEIRPIDFLFNK